MKRLSILPVMILLCALLLCACGNEQTEEISSGESPGFQTEKPESPLPEAEPPLYLNGEGKYGLLDESGNILLEASYDFAKTYDNFAVFGYNTNEGPKSIIVDYSGEQIGPVYDSVEPEKTFCEYCSVVGKTTDGICPNVKFDRNSVPELEYVPNEIFWLLNELGKPIIDKGFKSYWFMDSENEVELLAAADGAYYQYAKSGEEFILTQETPPSEYEDDFGYIHTSYCYSWHDGWRHGLKNKDGSIIAEPIYKMLEVPFSDRVILYEGSSPNHGWDCGRVRLIDREGNVYSNCFSVISYSIFANDSYIGVAVCCGPDAEVKCYDASGGLMPFGYWFVDKDGNILSERFEDIYFGEPGALVVDSDEAAATAVTASGETVTLSIEEYIRRQ